MVPARKRRAAAGGCRRCRSLSPTAPSRENFSLTTERNKMQITSRIVSHFVKYLGYVYARTSTHMSLKLASIHERDDYMCILPILCLEITGNFDACRVPPVFSRIRLQIPKDISLHIPNGNINYEMIFTECHALYIPNQQQDSGATSAL